MTKGWRRFSFAVVTEGWMEPLVIREIESVAHLRSCVLERRTAGPSAAPDFLSCLVTSRSSCGFPYRKPHTLSSPAQRRGNPGTLGMTNLGAVADLRKWWRWIDRVKQRRSPNLPGLHYAPLRVAETHFQPSRSHWFAEQRGSLQIAPSSRLLAKPR
jgi:hypothetical protein